MKTSLLSLAVFAGLSAAQFSALPDCAKDCAAQQFSGGSYAGCGTDVKCICSNQKFLGTIACCLAGVCSEKDQQGAISFAQQLCSAQGVSVPTVVSCSTAAAAATGTATSSPASATAATTTGSSSASSASSAAASSAASASSSTASSSSASSSATGTAASASSSSASGNWGPKPTPAMGMGAIGGLVAGLALL